jgi:hypothetical protein
MPRLTLVLRFIVLTAHLTAALALILTMGAPAHAVPIMINNGSAPPNAENVIDGADDYSGDSVHVRNIGCPRGWPTGNLDDAGNPCPSPGTPTHVAVKDGARLVELWSYDSSTVTMSGGTVGCL